MGKSNPIILIHGLWNTSSIFSSITSRLDDVGIEYFAPTLEHKYGITSIIELTNKLNELILEKYGSKEELDIVGFSMGGIIGRYWIQEFKSYQKIRRFISIGSPHKGTLSSQLVPEFPFKGISEMKINSKFLRELAKKDYLLDEIECISFFTYWDLMVFPGWWSNLSIGEKISLNVYKHRNLVKNRFAIKKIIDSIIK